jgi:hypothetical protein
MAVLVNPCACGFVRAFSRARTRVRLHPFIHLRCPCRKELWRICDQSFSSWCACNLCCRVLKMQNCNRNNEYVIINRY